MAWLSSTLEMSLFNVKSGFLGECPNIPTFLGPALPRICVRCEPMLPRAWDVCRGGCARLQVGPPQLGGLQQPVTVRVPRRHQAIFGTLGFAAFFGCTCLSLALCRPLHWPLTPPPKPDLPSDRRGPTMAATLPTSPPPCTRPPWSTPAPASSSTTGATCGKTRASRWAGSWTTAPTAT